MSLTQSSMLPLGTVAEDFTLLDTISQRNVSLQYLKSDKATVIMFICNHCPYVKHVQSTLVTIAQKYRKKGVQFIAINSNDADNYPEDSPDKMQEIGEKLNYSFPYLFDETQAVAKKYRAACTPDFYIFNKDLACVYRGRFDASTPGNNIPVTGEDLCISLDNLLLDKPINPNQKPSMGCNIKWK